MRLNVLDLPLF